MSVLNYIQQQQQHYEHRKMNSLITQTKTLFFDETFATYFLRVYPVRCVVFVIGLKYLQTYKSLKLHNNDVKIDRQECIDLSSSLFEINSFNQNNFYLKSLSTMTREKKMTMTEDLLFIHIAVLRLAKKIHIDDGEADDLFSCWWSYLPKHTRKKVNIIERHILHTLEWNLNLNVNEFETFFKDKDVQLLIIRAIDNRWCLIDGQEVRMKKKYGFRIHLNNFNVQQQKMIENIFKQQQFIANVCQQMMNINIFVRQSTSATLPLLYLRKINDRFTITL
ncbi:unnamed protein product [Didymodactylos carnosus]|uniref:Uncharacterized protein n=1 Tax=Didymodactylos carnosus TaxID=1234261 RepID=A0A815HZD1_9BILA|nr:unnamed protein product [Didymodactylos carnosus]CAF1359415.1 unnamed protein product [Didymodactylos carnosus]CAF3934860.1 unnamed protein product [Didymodactylos carnosus]CAF4236451.1 unnamed protein product [Didymodactylos carnosus]